MSAGDGMSSMRSRKTLVIGVTVNLEHYENLRLEVSGEAESVQDADDLIGYLDGVLGRLGREDPATAERIDSYRRRVLVRAGRETVPATASGCHDGVCPLPADLLSEVVGPAPSVPSSQRRTTPVPATAPVSPSSPEGGASGNPPQGYPAPPGKTINSTADSPENAQAVHDPSGAEALPGTPQPASGRTSGKPGKEPSLAGVPASLSSKPASSPVTVPVSHGGERGSMPEKEPDLVPDTQKTDEKVPLPPGVCDLCSAPITEAERKTSQLFTSKNLCRTCMKKP
jgi:hypothetical protein